MQSIIGETHAMELATEAEDNEAARVSALAEAEEEFEATITETRKEMMQNSEDKLSQQAAQKQEQLEARLAEAQAQMEEALAAQAASRDEVEATMQATFATEEAAMRQQEESACIAAAAAQKDADDAELAARCVPGRRLRVARRPHAMFGIGLHATRNSWLGVCPAIAPHRPRTHAPTYPEHVHGRARTATHTTYPRTRKHVHPHRLTASPPAAHARWTHAGASPVVCAEATTLLVLAHLRLADSLRPTPRRTRRSRLRMSR